MTERPSGTITFLFTDIEGSTRLWERDEDTMRTALARHDAILRQAIESSGGYVFKCMGDAFCAAFGNPQAGVNAALSAQRSLNSEGWDERLGPIKVRMALHTGTAEERDGDYFGPPLNRVARLLAAGHGGQTLLSLATQELVRDQLPNGASLMDLGQHRLKDLFRPEHVYQLAASDLPAEFPALRTLDGRLTNLPVQPTPLIGREREVNAIINLLRRVDVRLVTLTGTGGTGKTRLSLQAAADLIDEYEDSVYFIALAPVRSAEHMLQTIAGTLAVKVEGDQPLINALKEHLADRQSLLVLDNFEQIMEAAPLVGDLLSAAPRLKVIVTSRERLRLYGEHDYPVPPLGLPEKGRKPTVAVLSQYEAVALFIQRAKAAKPGFEITEENAPAIAEICVKLEGLPLAIELAAARSNLLTPPRMLERLTSRLKALTGGARDLPARQQTIRGAIDWSYDLLNEGERTFFSRLGVFSGGWTLESAEAICGEGLPFDVLDGLESLLDKSLIRHMESGTDADRFIMLEVIREYAVEKLEQAGGMIREAHAAYFTEYVETEAPKVRSSEAQKGIANLNSERDNIRSAMSWSLSSEHPNYALRQASSLWYYWEALGSDEEGNDWLRRALERSEHASPKLLADTLRAAANIATRINEWGRAEEMYQQSLALYREVGDQQRVSFVLNNLGNIYTNKRDFVAARASFQEAVDLGMAINDETSVLTPHLNLAWLAVLEEHYDAALKIYQDVLEQGRRLKVVHVIGITLGMLAYLQIKLHNYKESYVYAAESLELAYTSGAQFMIANVCGNIARSSIGRGYNVLAVRLYGASAVMYQNMGIDISALPEGVRMLRMEGLELLKEQMTPEAYQAAWDEGRALSVDEAVRCALDVNG